MNSLSVIVSSVYKVVPTDMEPLRKVCLMVCHLNLSITVITIILFFTNLFISFRQLMWAGHIYTLYQIDIKQMRLTGFFLGTRLAAFPHRFSNCRTNLTLKGPFPHLDIKYDISLRLFVPQTQLTYQMKAYICLYQII